MRWGELGSRYREAVLVHCGHGSSHYELVNTDNKKIQSKSAFIIRNANTINYSNEAHHLKLTATFRLLRRGAELVEDKAELSTTKQSPTRLLRTHCSLEEEKK